MEEDLPGLRNSISKGKEDNRVAGELHMAHSHQQQHCSTATCA